MASNLTDKERKWILKKKVNVNLILHDPVLFACSPMVESEPEVFFCLKRCLFVAAATSSSSIDF